MKSLSKPEEITSLCWRHPCLNRLNPNMAAQASHSMGTALQVDTHLRGHLLPSKPPLATTRPIHKVGFAGPELNVRTLLIM